MTLDDFVCCEIQLKEIKTKIEEREYSLNILMIEDFIQDLKMQN
jgi:hypothetical protein